MSQHDYVISNDTGANVRSDLNNALGAIATINSGATEPSTTYAYQLWMDTSSNVLKIRNSANSAWYTLPISPVANGTVNYSTGVNVQYGGSTKLATTSTGIDVTGTVTADGLTVEKSAAAVSTLNRTTSDGDIQVFQKDGTTVGSIGTRTGRIKIGDGDCGLFFDDTNNRINPEGPDNTSANDAAIDLGGSTQRFKDLYLSGGVYLGGTGAANKLDDYEEGTWTPGFSGATIVPDNTTGKYTKIGNLVYIVYYTNDAAISGASGPAKITNLPFAALHGGTESYGLVHYTHGTALDGGCRGGYVSSTQITFVDDDNTSSASYLNGDPKYLMISGVYRTAS
jgi:hypothetical protein